MSYDYMIFRFTKPIKSQSEIDEDAIGIIDKTDNIKNVIDSMFPDIKWNPPSYGYVPNHSEGRLEFSLDDEIETKILRVHTSHHANSKNTIKCVLSAFGGLTAFDGQTLELFNEN